MKFKVDENLPIEVVRLLEDNGHDALTVLGQNLGGEPDTQIAEACKKEKRALITLDTDFSDIRTYRCSSANTLLIFELQIKHTERRIGSTNAHEWARIKKINFRPADRRPESFIPLLRDKNFAVFLPCRKAMAFACQPPCPVELTELPA